MLRDGLLSRWKTTATHGLSSDSGGQGVYPSSGPLAPHPHIRVRENRNKSSLRFSRDREGKPECGLTGSRAEGATVLTLCLDGSRSYQGLSASNPDSTNQLSNALLNCDLMALFVNRAQNYLRAVEPM